MLKEFADSKRASDYTSTDALELTRRAANCLRNADIKTVGELCSMKREKLLRIRHFGKKSLKEVESKLQSLGRCLEDSKGGRYQIRLFNPSFEEFEGVLLQKGWKVQIRESPYDPKRPGIWQSSNDGTNRQFFNYSIEEATT